MAVFETALLGKFAGLPVGVAHSLPGIEQVIGNIAALHLEFEQSAWTEAPGGGGDVTADDFAAGDVLEDDLRIGKIERDSRENIEVLTVVLVDVDVIKRPGSSERAGDHLAADIDGVNLAENLGERTGDASGAAAYFENTHVFRALTLADVAEVIQDVVADGFFAGCKERMVIPAGLGGGDVIVDIFPRALVPIPDASASGAVWWSSINGYQRHFIRGSYFKMPRT